MPVAQALIGRKRNREKTQYVAGSTHGEQCPRFNHVNADSEHFSGRNNKNPIIHKQLN
jgi:hypothetical protein